MDQEIIAPIMMFLYNRGSQEAEAGGPLVLRQLWLYSGVPSQKTKESFVLYQQDKSVYQYTLIPIKAPVPHPGQVNFLA